MLLKVGASSLVSILVYIIKQYLKVCKSFYKFGYKSTGRIFTKSLEIYFISVK